MDIIGELSCNGVAPTGPVSAWPQERNQEITKRYKAASETVSASPRPSVTHATKVNASVGKMAKGLLETGAQAIAYGKVLSEVRNERYDTCKACPFFVEDSKRCSECGCFMEAKTWIGGDPKVLCPKQKWSR